MTGGIPVSYPAIVLRRYFMPQTNDFNAMESFIYYYNTERIQRKLHLMTPVEYHENYYAAA